MIKHRPSVHYQQTQSIPQLSLQCRP